MTRPSGSNQQSGLVPSGPAGGNLGGGYPDPRVVSVGNWRVLETAADYEFHFPAVGGLHTIDAPAIQVATVQLPPGNRVHIASTGSLSGIFGVQIALVGNYAGPLVSGDPLRMQSIAIVQTNPGGVSIDGTATAGGSTILRNVVLTSPIPGTPVCAAGSIHDLTATGLVVFEGINIDSQTQGLTFAGQIGAVRIANTSISNMAAGAIAFTLTSTCTINIGIAWQSSIYLTSDAGQRVVRIDPAATIPNTPVTVPTSLVGVRLTNNGIAVAGAIGAVMDETGITESDIRVLSVGSLYGRNSRFLGAVNFIKDESAAGTPIVKTYSLANTFETFRRSNGGVGLGDSITLQATSERFDLVTPGADPPGEWYVRYLGPLPLSVARVQWGVSLEAAATGSTVRLRAEIRQGALGAWTPIPESERTTAQENNVPDYVGGLGFVSLNPDDHIRVTIANDNAAASTEIDDFSLSVSTL